MVSSIPLSSILIPNPKNNVIRRPRLLAFLNGLLESKLVLVTAPAGYGKSTFLTEFAHQNRDCVAWCTLPQGGMTLQQFVLSFVLSIRRLNPDFGKDLLPFIQPLIAENDVNVLAVVLTNEFHTQFERNFYLILDAYEHIVDNPGINEFLCSLIKAPGNHSHFILTSRRHPILLGPKLLSNPALVEMIGPNELAFTTDEIQQFVLQRHALILSDIQAGELVLETEGWITGLVLSAIPNLIAGLTRSAPGRLPPVGLRKFLEYQVLADVPEYVQNFLLYSSLLGDFTVSDCSQILNTIMRAEDLTRAIELAMAENLLIVSTGDVSPSFRYHRQFSHYLQARLEEAQPDLAMCIRRAAGDYYRQNRQWQRALFFYLQIHDEQAAADLIAEAGTSLIKAGKISLLGEWLDNLPPALLDARPALISLKGVVVTSLHGPLKGLALFDDAIANLAENPDNLVLIRFLLRRAMVLYFLRRYSTALQDLARAEELVPGNVEAQNLQAEIFSIRGVNLTRLGRMDAAIHQLRLALRINRQTGDEYNVAQAERDLAIVYRSKGEYTTALELCIKSLNFWIRQNNLANAAMLYNNQGVIHRACGEVELAVQSFQNALENAVVSGNPRSEAFALASIGDLYLDLGLVDLAEQVLARSRKIASQINQKELFFPLALSKASAARKQKDFPLAACLLEECAEYILDGESSEEQGAYLFEKGRLLVDSQNDDLAASFFLDALKSFTHSQNIPGQAGSHLFLFILAVLQNNQERAAEELKASLELFTSMENAHTLILLGQEFHDLLEPWAKEYRTGIPAAKFWDAVQDYQTKLPVRRRFVRYAHPGLTEVTSELTLRGFGKGQIFLKGHAIPQTAWKYPVGREVLFFLASRPEGATKETLGGIFWPELSAAQLTEQMKSALYGIRKAIRRDIILTMGDCYFFNRDLDYSFDVEIFENLQKQLPPAPKAKKIMLLREMVALYTGDMLTDLGGRWIVPLRERLSQVFLDSILKLGLHYFESGEFSLALDYALKPLEYDLCWEPAHRLLMQIYAAMGSRSQVVEQYKLCKRSLQHSYQVLPSPETQLLYNALIR